MFARQPVDVAKGCACKLDLCWRSATASPKADSDDWQVSLFADTAVQAFLISKAESCSALPRFPSVIDGLGQTFLRGMLADLEDLIWYRGTLAAFLIENGRELAALDVIVDASKVELLVTVVIDCVDFSLAQKATPLYVDGPTARCGISLQLFAYASRKSCGEHIAYKTAGMLPDPIRQLARPDGCAGL